MNLTKTTQSLEKNGYKVSVFQTLEEADRYLNQQIDSTTVGLGGSMTIEEMGSFQTLSTHNEVYWHWHPADGLTAEDTRKKRWTLPSIFHRSMPSVRTAKWSISTVQATVWPLPFTVTKRFTSSRAPTKSSKTSIRPSTAPVM